LKGLILAGGSGTRLRPFSYTGNKHAMLIANKPMVSYAIEHLAAAGIREIGVVVGPLKEGIEDIIGDGSKFGVNVRYIDQPEPKGIAHAIKMARDFIQKDDCIAYLGDNLLKMGVKPLIDAFSKGNYDATIGVYKVKDPRPFGVVELKKGKITGITEKPAKPKSNYVMIGIYLFKPILFDVIDKLKISWRGEFEMSEAIQSLLDSKKNVLAYQVQGWWKDTGKAEDLLDANRLVLQDLNPDINCKVDPKATVTGRVSIGKGSKVLGESIILGPAIIGEKCTIGPAAYIGPYTSIAKGSIVRNCEVENSMIMPDCTIEGEGRIVESIIGANSRVYSANSKRPNGSRLILGERSLVGL